MYFMYCIFILYKYMKKLTFMTSLLYVIAYTQSSNIKEYLNSSPGLQLHSLNTTENPKDEK
jgi:hypothetical protein